MRIPLLLSALFFLAGCGKGLSITRYEAMDIVKSGGGVTVSASDMTRLRTHCGSQKMTVAAMQMADMKVWAHRS